MQSSVLELASLISLNTPVQTAVQTLRPDCHSPQREDLQYRRAVHSAYLTWCSEVCWQDLPTGERQNSFGSNGKASASSFLAQAYSVSALVWSQSSTGIWFMKSHFPSNAYWTLIWNFFAKQPHCTHLYCSHCHPPGFLKCKVLFPLHILSPFLGSFYRLEKEQSNDISSEFS